MQPDNYYSDHRVRGAERADQFQDFNQKTMTATYCDQEVKVRYTVCPTCNGHGKHVNPSIDCNGLSCADFDEDPGFYEEYLSGTYDVTCYECHGRNVVLEMDREATDPEIVRKVEEWEKDVYESRRIQEAERRMGA